MSISRGTTGLGFAALLIAASAAALTGASTYALEPVAPEVSEPGDTPAMITREEVVAALRAVPGVSAEYREQQYLALLDAPLESRGTMHFAPPGKLAKHQSAPARARTVVADGRLRFADAYGRDELDIAGNPAVALFVGTFLDVLAGRTDRIEASWTVGFVAGADGDPRAWVLALRPRTEPGTKLVDRLVVRGREATVSRIEVVELGGDRTVTTLSAVDVTRQWDPEAIAKTFSVD
jgi:hypothetical protein